mgnify:CR=1 FL=1
MVANVPAKRGRKPSTAAAAQPTGQVQSLTRGLKLLESIAESHGSVALTELAQQLYRDWLPASGEELRDFPLYMHYMNFVHEVPEHELVTDIYLPLKTL